MVEREPNDYVDIENWGRSTFFNFSPITPLLGKTLTETHAHNFYSKNVNGSDFGDAYKDFVNNQLPQMNEGDLKLELWNVAAEIKLGIKDFITKVDENDTGLLSESENIMSVLINLREAANKFGLLQFNNNNNDYSEIEAAIGNNTHWIKGQVTPIYGYLQMAKSTGNSKFIYLAEEKIKNFSNSCKLYFGERIINMEASFLGITPYLCLMDLRYEAITELRKEVDFPRSVWFVDNFQSEMDFIATTVDHAKFTNVIQNLIMNAQKYSGLPEDKLQIALWTGIGNDKNFRMIFANSGVGFAPEMLELDSEYGQRAFRKGETTEGTGEGLFQVWQWVVNEMKGKAKIFNSKNGPRGVNASISFEIPLL